MAGWPGGLLINISIHRNIDGVPAFRFRPYYVNLLFTLFFWAVLQSHLFGCRVKLDEIFDFRVWSNFGGLIWQLIVSGFSSLCQ